MKNPYFNLIKTVWQYGFNWRYSIVAYYLAYVIAQGVLSISPFAFGKAIDVLQNFHPERLHEVIYWLILGVVAMFVFWLFHGPARVVERRVAMKIQQSFRVNFYKQLTRLPLKWHQEHHSGNTITRISRASTSLYRFAESQFIYVETIVRFLAAIGFLLWISPTVGLISLAASFIIIGILTLYDRTLIPLYDAENEVENHVGSVLFDYISNMTTVLTLRLGELTRINLYQRMMTIWPVFKKDTVVNEAKWFTMMMLFEILQAAILIGYIIHELNANGAIMIGVVVMIFRYQWELHTVFQDVSVHLGEIVRMNTDVKSVQPILDDINKLAHATKGSLVARHWHEMNINNLSFHHSSNEERGRIFDQIHFSIKRGEKIALIGRSGGGKSTLLNLLCGLYTPSSVHLKIDESEFNTLEPLQAITTLIPQDPEIFENTIGFNITLDLQAKPEEVEQAIALAQFAQVLEAMPLKLKTDIREKGVNLSVGQKQRLALARGLFAARYSSLILMDEPTSSVDLPTEMEILSGVIKAFPDTAMIISLHRLHLLPNFDSVLMLDGGKVIASGPVPQVLEKPGPIRDLWEMRNISR